MRVPSTARSSRPYRPSSAAQRYKAPEHLAKRPAVVAPEIRDGLEVGPEATQKPDHLEVSVGLHLQAPAGTDAVEVPIDVELQEIARIVPRSFLSL